MGGRLGQLGLGHHPWEGRGFRDVEEHEQGAFQERSHVKLPDGEDVERQGQGHAREAVGHYRKAVELAPKLVEAHNNLGYVFLELEELDKAAQDLNISRQAVIKTLVRQALDQHYLAQRAKRPQSGP